MFFGANTGANTGVDGCCRVAAAAEVVVVQLRWRGAG